MKKATYAIIGASLIYVASAFLLPFPSDFFLYGICTYILGGLTDDTYKVAMMYLYTIGTIVIILGIGCYIYSGKKISLTDKKKRTSSKQSRVKQSK